MIAQPCHKLAAQLGSMFECAEAPQGAVRIRTPFYYPDGGIVDVFLYEDGGFATVTDFGETMAWLRGRSATGKRSARQNRLLQDAVANHGVQFFQGELTARVASEASLADVVVKVSQAAVRVSDLWFTMRPHLRDNVLDEVASALSSRRLKSERGVQFSGASGTRFDIDFHVQGPSRPALVMVLGATTRQSARHRIEHVFTAWSDIKPINDSTGGSKRFISLFDVTDSLWSQNDYQLVESVSSVVSWSDRNKFFELLDAA